MELIYHTEICQKALPSLFSQSALDIIIKANHRQDGIFTGLLGHPEYHFDGNKFEESWAFVKNQHGILQTTLKTNEEIEKAWKAFGSLLHAVQDFYAHSNYVKLWLTKYSPAQSFSVKDFNGLDESILDSPDLRSSIVYYPLEALTYFEFMRPLLRPLLPEDSHANMNLDSPIMGPLFLYAMEGARQRSKYEYDLVIQNLNPAQIDRFHGKII